MKRMFIRSYLAQQHLQVIFTIFFLAIWPPFKSAFALEAVQNWASGERHNTTLATFRNLLQGSLHAS